MSWFYLLSAVLKADRSEASRRGEPKRVRDSSGRYARKYSYDDDGFSEEKYRSLLTPTTEPSFYSLLSPQGELFNTPNKKEHPLSIWEAVSPEKREHYGLEWRMGNLDETYNLILKRGWGQIKSSDWLQARFARRPNNEQMKVLKDLASTHKEVVIHIGKTVYSNFALRSKPLNMLLGD